MDPSNLIQSPLIDDEEDTWEAPAATDDNPFDPSHLYDSESL